MKSKLFLVLLITTIFSPCMVNAQSYSIIYKQFNGNKVASPNIKNLITMLEIPTESWRSTMGDLGYDFQPENSGGDKIVYAGDWTRIYHGIGINFFTKYTFKNRVEYYCDLKSNVNAQHYYENEFYALIESLKDYYVQENSDFIYFSYPYNFKIYNVAIQKENMANRIVVWRD